MMNVKAVNKGCLTLLYEERVNSRPHTICRCICGNIRTIPTSSLKLHEYKHCRCTKEHNSRLHQCWRNMKGRSKHRDMCIVCDDWKVYGNFRDWSLLNGYGDDKVLCRNGDVGDYSPENCRWDTLQNNNIEGHALTWKFMNPNKELVTIYNLRQFCIKENLTYTAMQKVHSKTRNHHKGWTKYEDDCCKPE